MNQDIVEFLSDKFRSELYFMTPEIFQLYLMWLKY